MNIPPQYIALILTLIAFALVVFVLPKDLDRIVKKK